MIDMKLWISWLFPSDPIALAVLLGVVVLGSVTALVGCFTFLRKRALVGDAVAHAILPGVCLAFMLTESRHPLWLLLGAVAAGWLALLAMDAIIGRTKLKTDAAIGIVLSVFFGLGILLLTHIQQSGAGNQSGLDKFLFGKAAAMTRSDIQLVLISGAIILVILLLFYKEFKLLAFDPDFAAVLGLPRRLLEFLLATITVVAVATGIQAVGVVLMAALLVTPAAAARFWTHRLSLMLFLAALFGGLSGWLGAAISLSTAGMPTGPWIVMVMSVLALCSFFLAPGRGILSRWNRRRKFRRKMLEENVLKEFFYLQDNEQGGGRSLSEADLARGRGFAPGELRRGLRGLQARGLVEVAGLQQWRLTSAGRHDSRRIVRLHRLWELYLNRRLKMAPDHVHHDAESIEHIITPELEAQLVQELDEPILDPHDSPIPGLISDQQKTT